MYKLISWCLLFIGCLHPLLALPVPDSWEDTLRLSAPDGDARSALDKLERVSLLQMLLEMSRAERGDGLRKAGKIILARIGGLILLLLNYSLLKQANKLPNTLPFWCQDCSAKILCFLFLTNSLQASCSPCYPSLYIYFFPVRIYMEGKEDVIPVSSLGTDPANTRGSMKKFQAFSGQDPNIFLSHLLARYRKQDKKRGSPSECFWKYCV
ncbi:urotensin-2 [Meles meles]|uniref:urotensin-2 n=1 Tax=Meles meles TaxID=9662 RepID=UPI001E69C06D|nr:urotensin-2 [Meles meles]